MTATNRYGQPVGEPVPDWIARPLPPRTPVHGRFCSVEPFDAACLRRAWLSPLRVEVRCTERAFAHAAVRYGFHFEGMFQRAAVVKGRNRGTACYSITDSKWPARRAAFERWLAPENFDPSGRQTRGLSDLL